MTDYLEMLFAPREEFGQGGEDIPALRALREEHEPKQLPKAVMAREEPEAEPSPNLTRDVEVFFKPLLRPGEETPLEGEKESVFFRMRPPDGQRGAEELERKLRRDSRRYDSGFYRY